MRLPFRAVPVRLSVALLLAACVGGEAPTDLPGGGLTGVAIQPALIPSPADASAAPINLIRTVTLRVSDDVVLDESEFDVSPTANSWQVVVSVPVSAEETVVVVLLYLINVANDGTESIQFSGRSDPITLTLGEEAAPDVPFVRGPLSNLAVTGVSITSAPEVMVAGTSQQLAGSATSSEPDPPTIFWTSLDPAVVSMDGSTATALSPGTATIVASAGAFDAMTSITVNSVLAVTTTALADGVATGDYGDQLAAAGGVPPYTWAVPVGALPDGLNLDPATGDISGSPEVAGTSTFTVEVTSSDGQTATRQLSITIYDVLTVPGGALPDGVVNQAYGPVTLTAEGGLMPFTWVLVQAGDGLPDGLTLATDGQVTGAPEVEGFYTFFAQVMSADGQTAGGQFSIDVRDSGFGQVVGTVSDAVNGQLIAGADVALDGPVPLQGTTDANGTYRFSGLTAGTYTVVAQAGGYVDNTSANLQVVDLFGEVVRADFALPPIGSQQRFGGLSGRVLDNGGNGLPGATVSISGGAQTNGIFRTTTTDADGTYALVGIVLDDVNQQPIQQFTVLASASGYQTAQSPVDLIQNETVPNVDFTLLPSSGQTVFFQDDFETDEGWTEFSVVDQVLVPTDGFWNRSTLDGITNGAYPQYVQLAPNDPSGGALPSPVQGSYAFWYGDPQNGNYLGPQIQDDFDLSGGTGVDQNHGILMSPMFLVPQDATNATLRFESWFEIESVNPNASGFDLMTIAIMPEGSTFPTPLATLNPFVDPTLTPRDAIPFTSGGFNSTPVWRTDFVDLSQFVGQNVYIVFVFETVDNLYNGFRGWLIDNVVVDDAPAPAGAPALAPVAPGAPGQPRSSR